MKKTNPQRWSDPMTEDDFWSNLEFRICRELRGMEDRALSDMWCDGLGGYFIRPQKRANHIEGTIWICKDGQTEMRFTMTLPNGVSTIKEINWNDLLPTEEMTDWLAIDVKNKHVTINIFNAKHIEE